MKFPSPSLVENPALSLASWVAVDWGTSNLRLWIFDQENQLLDRIETRQGMGRLSRDDFPRILLKLVEKYLDAKKQLIVICCGMVGSRQGWAEAKYLQAPCAPPTVTQATRVSFEDDRLAIYILPGIKQAEPADVMRGEETQLAGFISCYPEFIGSVCLPGTHTKWIELQHGEIKSFQTLMSGELFGLLSEQSILRHSVDSGQIDDEVFAKTISEVIKRKESLVARLFQIRAESLIADLTPLAAISKLSAIIIGDELAATEAYWRNRKVAIVGVQNLADLYCRALLLEGSEVLQTDSEAMTLAGLKAAKTTLSEQDL